MRTLEITNFSGLATAKRIPSINEAYELDNLDLRSNAGDLVSQTDADLLYGPPSASVYRSHLTGHTFLTFANFYVPTLGGGSEVTVLCGSGTVTGENDGQQNFAVPAGILAPTVFVRPYWNGSAWVNNWNYLSETYLTTLSYVSGYTIALDAGDTFFANSSIRNWAITNISKTGTFRAVATAPMSVGGKNQYSVRLSGIPKGWALGDILLIQKNFFPYNYLTGNSAAVADDISFHKVNDSLRIGYGGQAGRLSASVDYQAKTWLWDAFTFGDSPYQDSAVIKAMDTVNQLTLNPYNGANMVGAISTNLYSIPSSSVMSVPGNYAVRMTATLDGFQEFWVASSQFTILDTSTLFDSVPRLSWGEHSERVTSLQLYIATGSIGANNPFYQLSSLPVQESSSGSVAASWQIASDGFIEPKTRFNPSASIQQFNTGPNAVMPSGSTDTNSITGWFGMFPNIAIASQSGTVHDGTYAFKINAPGGILELDFCMGIAVQLPSTPSATYHLSFWAQLDAGTTTITVSVGNGSSGSVLTPQQAVGSFPLSVLDGWKYFSFDFNPAEFTQGFDLLFFYVPITNLANFYLDTVDFHRPSQQLANAINFGTEMSNALGYTPTQGYAGSWDKSLVGKGTTFVLNPYVDTRLVNKILKSPINSAGSFLYDVIVPEFFLDAETFDGNDVIDFAFNGVADLYIMRSNSVQTMNSDQLGGLNSLKNGDGLVSKRGAYSFGQLLFVPGRYDVYAFNYTSQKDVTDGTIRDLYRTLTDAQRVQILGTGEQNTSSYRFYAGDSTSQFTMTPRGWTRSLKPNIPVAFSLDRAGHIMYLTSSANLYKEQASSPYLSTFNWTSVPIEVFLVGPDVPANSIFHIFELWIRYQSTVPFVVNLFCTDKSTSTPQQSWNIPASIHGGYYKMRTSLGADSRRFQLQLKDRGFAEAINLTVMAVEAIYQLIPTGMR